ncbi:PREDICTED: uncharacterized protein LOC108546766 isoform X2 [Eufriesea mexicana]|uniref:uncharacterized protein LOC108546766 isoform X2 n=1 Tax=Eufriesea mexicana TaxID=516756 RepID=UPI00083C1968|nr:PREDICTED: uncharacterized protein LOC108546766 isoform X2 [Eufriesea mexicana]
MGTDESYEVLNMRSALIYKDLRGYVNETESKAKQNDAIWVRKDEKALIFLSITKNQLGHVKRAETSREAWESLNNIYRSKSPLQ